MASAGKKSTFLSRIVRWFSSRKRVEKNGRVRLKIELNKKQKKYAKALEAREETEKLRAFYVKEVIEKGGLSIEREMLDVSASKFPVRAYLARWLFLNMGKIKKRAEQIRISPDAAQKTYVFWSQGFENSPDIVQVCNRALLASQDPDSIVVLTEKNWRDYCSIPQDVIKRLEGQKLQFFADLLRVSLLAQRGGIWIDATCLPFCNLNEFYKENCKAGFFALTRIDNDRFISNWFLMADNGNYVVKMMTAALMQYWMDHNKLVDYYVFHLILEALTYVDPNVKKIWDQMPKIPSEKAHSILGIMREKYTDEGFKTSIESTYIQKLTYKKDWPEQDKRLLIEAIERQFGLTSG